MMPPSHRPLSQVGERIGCTCTVGGDSLRSGSMSSPRRATSTSSPASKAASKDDPLDDPLTPGSPGGSDMAT